MDGAPVTATDPRSWIMLGEFVTCLQRIRRADGYFTDAGAAVSREPKPATTRDPIVINVRWDGKRRPEADAMRRAGGFFNGITIEARVEAGRDDAQYTLHCLIDDIERSLEGQQSAFSSTGTFPQFESMQIIPAADGLPWVGADMLFTTHSKPR